MQISTIKQKTIAAQLLLGFSLLAASNVSLAATESEINGSFATADFANPGVNSGIVGDLSSGFNDADFWKFDLTAGMGFGATISNGPASDFNGFDPIIVLFMEDDGNFFPVAANNPDAFGTSLGFTPWESGTYFLSVTAFGNSPQDAFGNNQYDQSFWTDQSIKGTSFDQFQNTAFASFDYDLTLTGTVATTVVPVPAAAWLFASGLLGLVGLSRRKNQA